MGGKGRRKGGGKKGSGRARRKGGSKGQRRPIGKGGMGPRGTGIVSSFSVGGAGVPMSLPEDPVAPFLHPSARPLVHVPLEFSSLRQWCDIIGNNILAEFWQVFREARPTFTGFGGAAGDELIIDNAPADGFSQCLLLVNGQPRLATSQRILGVGKVAVKLRGGSAQSGQIKSLGYVGSFLAEYAACLELRWLAPQQLTGPMRAILEPKIDVPGSYDRRTLRSNLVPVNPSQKSAVDGLRWALEKIQGPPGTGKSTTIFHILDARVPEGERVLVTCSRNVAVESIAQKLAGLEGWPLCVFGPRDRVGETARKHLLDTQIGGQFEERKLQRVSPLVAACAQTLNEAISAREAQVIGCRHEPFLIRFLRRRYAQLYEWRDLCEKLASYCVAATQEPEWCKQQLQISKECTLQEARVFLCTIASSSRLIREWEEVMGDSLKVHTVIVDECGCTPESSTALLLRLRPSNLVLVGDHKQLPPCSVVSPQLLQGTGHTRSLLERCVLASGHVHQLREQYRMHPAISSIVSRLFYAGRLQTPQHVVTARTGKESRPLVWLEVQGREEAPERSYVNFAEVQAATRVCACLREQVGRFATIALLTFYRGQLQALMQAVPNDLDVEVLTVDACQGSEFDYVVLSSVRANREQRLGFVKDQQRINVAISRARLKLIIVGNRHTLSGDDDWKQIASACDPALPQEVRPRSQLAAPGSFVSVFDALKVQKEKEAEQKANTAMEEQEGRPSGKGKGKGKQHKMQNSWTSEELMRQQTSFSRDRQVPQRQADGTYQPSRAIAAALGGGFRRRADVAELEAQARHHLACLDAPMAAFRHQPKYSEAKSTEQYVERFPTLCVDPCGPGTKSATNRGSLPRTARGELRLASRNDEKKQRRAAQRAAVSASEPIENTSDQVIFTDRDPAEEERWEDIPEAMLFEMFPDEPATVEEALLRFAGLPHAPARALEALLARPSANATKNVLELEDDLDYDCAFADGGDLQAIYGDDYDVGAAATTSNVAVFDQGGFWEYDDYEEDEDDSYDEWLEPGLCEACGVDAQGIVGDDGMFYCEACWASWECAAPDDTLRGEPGVASAVVEVAGYGHRCEERPPAPPVPVRPAPPPIPERTQAHAETRFAEENGRTKHTCPHPTAGAVDMDNCDGIRNRGLSATEAEKTKPKAKLRQPERSLFFNSLDGAPKWADVPTRPEAGGKELVALRPKGERGEDEVAPPKTTPAGATAESATAAVSKRTGGRWGRGNAKGVEHASNASSKSSADTTPNDTKRVANSIGQSKPARCRAILEAVRPTLEDTVVDYVVSLVEDNVDDDTRDAVLAILEGYSDSRTTAEALWQKIVTP